MLLKGCGICMILAASCLLGYSLSGDYLTRIRNLEQINRMLMLLKGEIRYNNCGIPESVSKISNRFEDETGMFLNCVRREFEENDISLNEAWNRGISDVLEQKTKLEKTDITILRELGGSLGITDRETQMNSISNCMDSLEAEIRRLNEAREEKCRLYRTLSVMAGVFMAVVLI